MNLNSFQQSFINQLFETNLTPGYRIYLNNIIHTKTKALKQTYPIIHDLIGEACFRAVAKNYFDQEWQNAKTLTYWGKQFPHFLSHFEPLQQLPYLADMAALEWAYHVALHASYVTNYLVSGNLYFEIPSCNTVLASNFPILKIWQMHQPDYQGADQLELTTGENALIVCKRGWDVFIEPLEKEEYAFLRDVQNSSVESTCELWLREKKEAMTVLTKCIVKGWLCAIG